MSKGHAPRQTRDDAAYAANYDRIFGPEKALTKLIDLSQELGLYPAIELTAEEEFKRMEGKAND